MSGRWRLLRYQIKEDASRVGSRLASWVFGFAQSRRWVECNFFFWVGAEYYVGIERVVTRLQEESFLWRSISTVRASTKVTFLCREH